MSFSRKLALALLAVAPLVVRAHPPGGKLATTAEEALAELKAGNERFAKGFSWITMWSQSIRTCA